MLTRSQARARRSVQPFDVDIDFDDASRAWLANKKRVGQMYVYICGHTLRNGGTCQRRSLATCIDGYCFQHAKQSIVQDGTEKIKK